MTHSFTVSITGYADGTVRLDVPDEDLTELLDGEKFDRENAVHVQRLETYFWETSPDTPSICAQCSGWGAEYSLSVNDDWTVSEIWRNEEDDDEDADE